MTQLRSTSIPSFGFRLAATLLLIGCAGLFPAAAEETLDPEPQPRIDRRLGEEEEIRLREEWFFGSRRQGIESDAELWSLRRGAVEETRRALAVQQLRRSRGFEGAQNFWVSKGPSPSTFGGWAFGNVSGRVQAIAADFAGDVLYVGGGSGGVWKSTNDGLSWTNIFDTAGTTAVGAITVDPHDPSVLWVGTGDNVSSCESYFGIGLLRSADGGATWEPRNGSGASSLDGLASFAQIWIDPTDADHIVTGGRIRGCEDGSSGNGGVFTSDDGGMTWAERLANVEIDELAQDPTVPDIYWAGTSNGVYKSIDNGVTWALQNNGIPTGGTGRTEIAVSPSNPNVVYALMSNEGPGFYRTADGGASWTQQSSGGNACDGQCWYNMAIRVHQTDPDIVFRGTVHLFKSVDGGVNWSDLSNNWGSSQKVHQDMHALLTDPANPEHFYASGDGGIWKSENGGTTFSNLNGNLNITQFYAIGVDANDPERICGGAQDNSSLARSNNDVWDRQAVTGDGFVCLIDPQNPNRAYITSYPSGGYPNIWRSTNGLFGSFNDISGSGSGIISGDRINWVTPYVQDPVTPDNLYVGTHRIYKSVNGGSSWALVSPDLTSGSSSLLSIDINPNFPNYLYSGSVSGRVWRTTDGGTNWTDLTASPLPARTINDVGSDPTDADRVFAAVAGFNTSHLWEWNEGAGWIARGAGLPNVPANTVLPLSGSLIVVGTDVGVFLSFDGGENFSPFMDGLPEGLVVTDLEFNAQQNIITAGTYGRGVFQISIDPVQPILIDDSVELPPVELDGDGDTQVEPGETWSVRPILRNAGGQSAIGVSARLTTATAGIAIVDDFKSYGDIDPGQTASAATGYVFQIEPSFACGTDVAFDLVDITSTNDPFTYADRPSAFLTTVIDANDTPITTTLIDEDFETPPAGWSHEAVDPALAECPGQVHPDDWNLATKDAAHGVSYHAGSGPGNSYSRTSFSWLYPAGKDSESGPGLVVPADAIAATLTVEHWYDTVAGEDGGQVALDIQADGNDVYTTIRPIGGYPGGLLAGGRCNGLEGEDAFQGSSGGWVTSLFDLTAYKGLTVYPAFIFGADKSSAVGEGWYIDDIRLDYQQEGPPVCQVSLWPGAVDAAQFELLDPATIQATWNDACNIGAFPGQTYSIQVGDLDQLAAGGGVYTHAPLAGQCDLLSSATFAPGAGNQYYLVVPSGDGREGSAGSDSSGGLRPQIDGVCGQRRIECP